MLAFMERGEGLGMRGRSSSDHESEGQHEQKILGAMQRRLRLLVISEPRANEFAQDVWQMVRNRRCRGQKFRREYPIPPYTVDFCCVALKLIVQAVQERNAEHSPSSPALLPLRRRRARLAYA